ncbi:MAG TPA: SRPBCC family protein [Cyclobacteriaceae bacterium]|nr:SRPBCC family protein [Cyclobacteriaceae bacterium]
MKKIVSITLVVAALLIVTINISYLVSGGPTTIVNHVKIKANPEAVFEFASDMRNEVKWNPHVVYMAKISDGPIDSGTRFRAKWDLSDTVDVVITRYDEPHFVTFKNGGPIEVTVEIKLTSVGSDTEMESKFTATPHGFMRAIFPIFLMNIKKQEKEVMQNIKKAIEEAR